MDNQIGLGDAMAASERLDRCETYVEQEVRKLKETVAELEKQTKTLRDEFAMAAMCELIRRPDDDTISNTKTLSVACYAIADAMMEARNNDSK